MKKLLSVLTSVFIVSIMIAMLATSVSAVFIPGEKNFTSRNITIKKATGTINIDASPTPDAAYSSTAVELLGKVGTTTDSCKAHLAWDDDYLYILMIVNDTTNYSDVQAAYNADSIEFYVDFDNNKTPYNLFNTKDLYVGQYRVQRGFNELQLGVCGKQSIAQELISGSTVVCKENGTSGYVVEVKFPHKNYAITNKIGFALQVNDGDPRSYTRTGQLFSNPAGNAQDYCYQYTHLLETATLEGFTPTTTRQKAADNPDPSTVPKPSSPKPSSSSKSSAASSSKQSSSNTSSADSSSADTSSTDTSSIITSAATSSISTSSSVSQSVSSDVEANAPTSSQPSNNSDDGLDIGIIIAIVAGAIAVLAGVAIAVILIIKKKKATETDE